MLHFFSPVLQAIIVMASKSLHSFALDPTLCLFSYCSKLLWFIFVSQFCIASEHTITTWVCIPFNLPTYITFTPNALLSFILDEASFGRISSLCAPVRVDEVFGAYAF